MRARPREINIFNMSLLDILCGALGAFCFMMLVALPYYVVGGSTERQQTQKNTEDLIKELDDLRSRINDPATAEELRQMIDRLEAQVKQLEGQANQYAYENEQLKKEKETLTAENKTQKLRLKQQKPFLVLVGSSILTQEIDLYLQDDLIAEGSDKSANPPYDPKKPYQLSNWMNDLSGASLSNHGIVCWVKAETIVGTHYKAFVKYLNEPKERRVTTIKTAVYGDYPKGTMMEFPDVTLSPERFWTLVGTVSVDDDNKLSLKEATQAERDASWRELMKTEPPPMPTPAQVISPFSSTTPAPSAAPQPTPDLAALREKLKREQKGASPTPISSEEERALRERLRKERELRLASPTPSP